MRFRNEMFTLCDLHKASIYSVGHKGFDDPLFYFILDSNLQQSNPPTSKKGTFFLMLIFNKQFHRKQAVESKDSFLSKSFKGSCTGNGFFSGKPWAIYKTIW